jgi:hypothetical protein
VTFDGEDLVMRVGRTTQLNASEHPAVTLVWVAGGDAEFCLIVDGVARAADETLLAHPASAVLHRLGGAVGPR